MKRIITLALLLFASCEETPICPQQCLRMTISDALPVQFWLNDCETYNEKESCGIHRFCFYQPVECEDEITVQLTDDTDQQYFLQVVDESENELYYVEFDQTDNSVPGSPAVPGYDDPVSGAPAIEDGYNAGSFTAWTLGSNPSVSLSGAPTNVSKRLTFDFAFVQGKTYKITSVINYDTQHTVGWIRFETRDSGGSIVDVEVFDISGAGSGVYNTPFVFTAGADIQLFNIYAAFSSSDLGDVTDLDLESIAFVEVIAAIPETPPIPATKYINTTSFIPLSEEICDQKIQLRIVADEYEVVAKTDYLDVKLTHECTTLIQYRNSRNYAGIEYETMYSDEYFYKRVPSVFFHERFPEESETIELTDRIITLNGTLKAEKKLETDYMPYYEHRKMKLILTHQEVIINYRYWTKQEQYEINDSENKRFPLKSAMCWLTEKNYVQRNVL